MFPRKTSNRKRPTPPKMFESAPDGQEFSKKGGRVKVRCTKCHRKVNSYNALTCRKCNTVICADCAETNGYLCPKCFESLNLFS